jgi:hypothetical protein
MSCAPGAPGGTQPPSPERSAKQPDAPICSLRGADQARVRSVRDEEVTAGMRLEDLPARATSQTHCMTEPAKPLSPVEAQLLAVLRRQLDRRPAGSARIEQDWGNGAWDLSVIPAQATSATVGCFFDGDDTVYLFIADTQVELFPYTPEMLVFIEGVVDAVMDGRVEQAGSDGHTFVRVELADGAEEMGYIHLPTRWSRRSDRRRFIPYGDPH